MNKVQQEAYFRQRVVKEVLKGRSKSEVARRHKISRMSVYRWCKRFNGSVESLREASHRPQEHPMQHSQEEYTLIRRVQSHNKGLGLVCLHMVLEQKHGYARSVSGLYRAMKRLNLGRRKQRKRKHIPHPVKRFWPDTRHLRHSHFWTWQRRGRRKRILTGRRRLYHKTIQPRHCDSQNQYASSRN